MKKLTLLIFIGLFLGNNSYKSQLTSTENYVYSKTYLSKPGDAEQRSSETVTYFDGLGRPKQTINIRATPQAKDIVTHVEYDGFGRQVKDYLPVPQTGSSNGAIYSLSPLSNAGQTYGTEKIYAEKILESSPLDRIQQQVQPGTDWEGHPVRYDYQTNTATDVLRFSTDTHTRNGAFYTYELKVDGFYPASTLYKNMISDEDGNTSYEFKNGEGQTLLVRKLLGNIDIVEQGLAAPQPSVNYVDTYYVYNEYNQLAFVIPPLAVNTFRANNTQTISDPQNGGNAIINDLCYQYNYDGRNRLVEKKLPGKDWEEMVYDRSDRLILSRDARMKGNDQWLLTKYDKFGRVVYTGFITGSERDRPTQQGIIKDMLIVEEPDGSGFTRNGLQIYYTNNLFYEFETALSVNYYDSYPDGTPFPTYNSIQGVAIITGTPDAQGVSTRTLPLATMVKNINDDNWTRNYSYYDAKGRVIGTTSINHLGGRTITELKLDFAGVVKHSETWHNKVSTELPVHIIEDFTYDHQNRLKKHYHEVEGKTPKELLADNTYDELGRLETKKVGAVSDANFAEVMPPLQTINYAYNIRGWMTGINLNTTGGLDIGKLFSYKIKYNDPVNTAIRKYNGNISEVDWTYGSNNGSRYEYTYDDLNRLRKGYYKTLGATTTTDSKHFNEELTYDANGNIKTLKRNARPKTGTTATQVDNLVYYYDNNALSNRLQRITDNEGATPNPSGYPGGGGTNTYDVNGNMLTMPDKGITQNIVYNYLNLPQAITRNGNPVTYTYRADGVKVHKGFEVNGQNIQTWYLDGFVYTTPYTPDIVTALEQTPEAAEMAAAGQVESFELAEKVVVKDPGGPVQLTQSTPNFFSTAEGFYDYDNFRYIYQYKDHLGNTRLNFGRDEDGVLFAEDSNDYYPFGLNFINPPGRIASQVFNPSATYKNYKYNGKELQETGMYDYGARQYMGDVGRWISPDPLSEEFSDWSPYNYALNNPLSFTDPDGNAPEDAIETGCCPNPSDDNAVAEAFVGMIGGGINSVRAAVSNLAVRGINLFRDSDKQINTKYEVGGDGSLTLVTGVPKESTKEKISNTAGDLATIGLSVLGGPEGALTAQGGKSAILKTAEDAKSLLKAGRSGKQERLKELANDTKLGKSDKGWIKSEMNQVANGNRKTIRNPPGKDLAHERGREAAKGYSYKNSNLQDRSLHRKQHKYDNGGRKNKERPVN